MCKEKSLPDLFAKFHSLFHVFLHYNILIQPRKSYLNYPDVVWLDQQVNSLGLLTSKRKLKIVRRLRYLETLGALEYYLGLTKYLKSYIYYYA